MKISIITPSYNSAATIRDTLESVSRQTYRDREHIIVDGGSGDRTVAIIKEYAARPGNAGLISFISEKDRGLYDAMNKGIRRASGDIVGILNSDDFYKNDEVLALVAAAFTANPELDAVYGDLEFVGPDDINKVVRFWRTGEYREKRLNNGWIIPHPTLFLRRAVYQKFGGFRTDLELAGDYELLLRLLKIGKIKTAYRPLTMVRMRVGGRSGKSLTQRIKGWRELKRAWSINDLPLPKFFITRRVLSKLIQYLKK
jgi:glycosyltransferase